MPFLLFPVTRKFDVCHKMSDVCRKNGLSGYGYAVFLCCYFLFSFQKWLKDHKKWLFVFPFSFFVIISQRKTEKPNIYIL